MCNTNDFNIDEIALSEFGEVTFFGDEQIENLTEIAVIREDPWNEYPEVKPDTSNVEPYSSKRLIVESNRGVDVASYHQYPSGWVFQDRSGADEGMYGGHDEPYTVYRWMELPEGKCEKE